jgi:hypothetical protein
VFFTESAKLGSSMVDAADLDGDGWLDLVFANGGGYDKGDMLSDLPQQAFRNMSGTATWSTSAADRSSAGANSFNGRAVKIRDIDRDGDNDIMLGCHLAEAEPPVPQQRRPGRLHQRDREQPAAVRRQHRRPRARRRRRRRRPRHDPR